MKRTLAVARKEMSGYFGSPLAFIFIGVFLSALLFLFFWRERFFARGIADVRPLFRSMPMLLIFLVAALTMRQWSEEQSSGTLETLLTLPVPSYQLALGKFLAVTGLVGLALALTLPIPITVAFMGDLDWGPVVGGYAAALLLTCAYAAIGLFLSSRTDNPFVALIMTAIVGGIFYLIGAGAVTNFAGDAGDLFRALGAGSRFESIERGVLDLRDLLYYLSIAAGFLILNAVSLDAKRWSKGEQTKAYRRAAVWTTALLLANITLLNIWMYPLYGLRLDLTSQRQYSLSKQTKQLLGGLSEPLLMRAYISKQTHPLLDRLRSQIADMLTEYAIAGKGMIETETIDPSDNEELMQEARDAYGIVTEAFLNQGRAETSVRNIYFNILVRYGDQHEVFGFRDITQIEPLADGGIEVRLRNLEYDLTRAVKKSAYGFQSIDTALESFQQPAELTLYATPNTLPEGGAELMETFERVGNEIAGNSNGKLLFRTVDPTDPNSGETMESLAQKYGLRPMRVAFLSTDTYYFSLILAVDNQFEVVLIGSDLEADIRKAVEASIKRMAPGFLKVAGLWVPPRMPTQNAFGQMTEPFASYQSIAQQLQSDYTVQNIDLSSGSVPAEVDSLVIAAPQNLNEKELFAIDQYLMRGGSAVIAGGAYLMEPDQFTRAPALKQVVGGARELLSHYGVEVGASAVMDMQNEPLTFRRTRQVGNFVVPEITKEPYPFFIDIRQEGMASGHPIAANLSAVTLHWASPILLDKDKNANRDTAELLKSSEEAWTTTDTNVNPDLQTYPDLGFHPGQELTSHTLAVAVKGSFESYFKDKPSPLLTEEPAEENDEQNEADESPALANMIESSPESSRLVVIGSSEFINDSVIVMSSDERARENLQLIQNAVDWSVEDLDLLSIRARGAQSRLLKPMTEGEQRIWEIANYVLALASLGLLALMWQIRRRSERPIALEPLETKEAEESA